MGGRQQHQPADEDGELPPQPPSRSRRSCRVCSDDQQLFTMMRKQINMHTSNNNGREAKRENGASSAASSAAATAAVAGAALSSSAVPPSPSPSPSASTSASSSSLMSSSTPAALPCPPDSARLGRASWTFLHTLGAYYPDSPSNTDQSLMKQFLNTFARFYPCPPCAEHMQMYVEKQPPDTSSRHGFSMYLCHLHNEVNTRLGKPMFDCKRYDERWRDGPPDGATYDCVDEE